jgi:hypothetical protein
LVEHTTENCGVGSSILPLGTKLVQGSRFKVKKMLIESNPVVQAFRALARVSEAAFSRRCERLMDRRSDPESILNQLARLFFQHPLTLRHGSALAGGAGE